MWNKPQLMLALAELLYVCAGAALFIAALVWCARLPMFPLTEVVFTHALSEVEREDLEDALSGHLTGNFFSINLNAIRGSLETVPWVRRVEVRRQWPGRLDISIEEHQAVAAWGRLGSSANVVVSTNQWVNSHGEIFTGTMKSPSPLPVFLGAETLAEEMLDFYQTSTAKLQTIGRSPALIRISERQAIQLQLDDNMMIELGRRQAKAPPEMRLDRFIEFYPSVLSAAKKKPLVVDMRYPKGFALRTGSTLIDPKGTP